MKKVKVFIKEVIVQEFEVEVSDTEDFDKLYYEIRDKYKKCELVVENPEVDGVYGFVYDGGKVIDLGDLDIY